MCSNGTDQYIKNTRYEKELLSHLEYAKEQIHTVLEKNQILVDSHDDFVNYNNFLQLTTEKMIQQGVLEKFFFQKMPINFNLKNNCQM